MDPVPAANRAGWLTLATLVIKLVVMVQLLQHTLQHVLQLVEAAVLQGSLPLQDTHYLLWRLTAMIAAVAAPFSSCWSALAHYTAALLPAAPAPSSSSGLLVHPAAATLLLAAAAWLAAEALFQLLWFRPRFTAWNKLCSSMSSPAGLTPAQSSALFQRFIQVCRDCPCDQAFLEAYLSTWFRGAGVHEIHRGNMEELFAYGFYYKTRQQMQDAGLGHLPSQMAAEFEAVFGLSLPPGYNPRVSFMSHLWDELRVHSRPLAFYAVTEGLALLAALCMHVLGFQQQQHGPLRYYTLHLPDTRHQPEQQQQQQQQSKQAPVVFMHGVVGLVLYLPVVAWLAASGAPLIVLDMRHVGLRLCRTIPSIDALTASLASVLAKHHLAPAVVMAHSYGTLLASRLLRLHRPAVARLVLIDPVCVGMFMPRLLNGFLYAQLSLKALNLRSPLAAVQQLMLWLVAKDLHLAATFSRGFFWSDLNLWPKDLPAGSMVVLGGADALIQAPEIAAMLEENPNVKVLLKPGLIHGGFMLDHHTRCTVLAEATTAVAAATVVAAAGVMAAAETTCQAGAAAATAASKAVRQLADIAPDGTHGNSNTSSTCSASRDGGTGFTCKHSRTISADSAASLTTSEPDLSSCGAASDSLSKPPPVAAIRASFGTWHHTASDSASSLLDEAAFAAFDCTSSSSRKCGSWPSKSGAAGDDDAVSIAEVAHQGAEALLAGLPCSLRDWQMQQLPKRTACKG